MNATLFFRCLPLALFAAAVAAPLEAATTLPEPAWTAFARANHIERCFPGFIETLETKSIGGHWDAGEVLIPVAQYNNIKPFGKTGSLATNISSTDPAARMLVFTAERNGAYVSFSLQAPGGTTAGFVLAPSPTIALAASGPLTIERFTRSLPPAVLRATGVKRCGMTAVTFHYPEQEGIARIIVRDGNVIAATQSDDG